MYPPQFGFHASIPPMPTPLVAPAPWIGPTEDVDAENAKIASQVGVTKPIPGQATDELQYWVRELGGVYSLRTTRDIKENCQPGQWMYSTSGYPYFIRENADLKAPGH
jgi:hypothetical protein